MEDQNQNKEKAKKNSQFVYFITSHIKSKNCELFLDDKNENINCLEKVLTKEVNPSNTLIYEVEIYRFSIFLNKIINKNEDKIIIFLKYENNTFESKINIQKIEKERDCFLYDFQFEPIKKFIIIISPPSSLNLLDYEKFGYFIDFIKNENKSENEKAKIKEDLIYYTQQIFKEKKENKILYFYSYIFTECYENKDAFLCHISLYDKIIKDMLLHINDYCNKHTMNRNISEKINLLCNDINPIFKYTEEEIIKQNMVNSLFYFNYFYQKKEINKMIENKDIKEFFYKILVENENQYQDLKLNKNSINILIKLANNFNQIYNIFKYNNDFLDLLEISNENIDLIYAKYDELDNKLRNKKIIKFKHLVETKKEDDLEKICNQINILINHEKEKSTFIFKFSYRVLNKYLEMFSDSELNNLILVYNISKYIKRNDNISSIKNINKISNILHNKGLFFIQRNRLNNDQILSYLENDDFFINSKNSKVFMSVINNFEAKSISSDFLMKWKKIDWAKRYKNDKIQFFNQVGGLVKDMDDFGYLFDFFDLNEKEKNYEAECLIVMRERYQELYDFNKKYEKEDQFINQTVDLIYYCELKEVDAMPVIKKCLYRNKQENIDIIDKIFKKLIAKKDDYSENLTNIIVDFFNENILQGNSTTLKYILRNKKKDQSINSDFLLFLDNFSIEKKDFFSLEETDHLLVFKELFNYKFLEEDILGNSKYYRSYNELMTNLSNELEKLDIEYNDVEQFYSKDKTDILYKRLLLITKNDETVMKSYKDKIDKAMEDIDNILKDFEYILHFLKFFFPEAQKENIKKIEEFRDNIKNGKLNYYKEKYQFYLDIKREFGKEAKEFSKFKNNKLIEDLYSGLKANNQNEDKNFSEIKEFLEIMKLILEENNLKPKIIDFDHLEKYLLLLNISNSELLESINLMANSFDIKKKINSEKMCDQISYLKKKPKFIDFVQIFTNFIELLGVKKTYYYNSIKIIHKNLNESKDISTIKLSESILEKYGFKINDNTNKFQNLLIKLKDKKEEKDFLFEKKNQNEFLKKLQQINDEANNLFIGFDKVFSFISKYVNSKDKMDKDIIHEIKDDFNNDESLQTSFDNYLDKFTLFRDKNRE